jgi:hypothetical protein
VAAPPLPRTAARDRTPFSPELPSLLVEDQASDPASREVPDPFAAPLEESSGTSSSSPASDPLAPRRIRIANRWLAIDPAALQRAPSRLSSGMLRKRGRRL